MRRIPVFLLLTAGLFLTLFIGQMAAAQQTISDSGITFTVPASYQTYQIPMKFLGDTQLLLVDSNSVLPALKLVGFTLITPVDNPRGLDAPAAYIAMRDDFLNRFGYGIIEGGLTSLTVNGSSVSLDRMGPNSTGQPDLYTGLMVLPNNQAGIILFSTPLESDAIFLDQVFSSIQVESPSDEPDYVVNSVDDSPNGCPENCTLRHALSLAGSGETIGFADGLSGTIMLRAPLVIDKSIRIIGPGADLITVDGGGAVTAFIVRDDTDAVVMLVGMRVQNGVCEYTGGAVQIRDGIKLLTLDGMVFENNTCAGRGGAVAVTSTPNVVIRNSSFINNSTIADDSADSSYTYYTGGAVDIGVIGNLDTHSTYIEGSTFIGNTSLSAGGAVAIAQALNFYGDASMTITNSTFAGNSAQETGGAISGAVPTTLNYVTVVDNAARTGGGLSGNFVLNDSIISGSRSVLGGPGEDFVGRVMASSGTNIIGTINPETDESPLVFDQRVDPMVLELGDYGGQTKTFALAEGSPAINTGGGSSCPVTDQRGEPRTPPCDIGAVEYTGVVEGALFASAAESQTDTGTGGMIAFVAFDMGSIQQINGNGTALQPLLDAEGLYYHDIAWSPDGTRLVFSASADAYVYNLYTANADGSNVQMLTSYTQGEAVNAVWSPDGTRVVYNYGTRENSSLFIIDANGGTPVQIGRSLFGASWSPDGVRLAAVGLQGGVYVLNADGSGSTRISEDSPSAGNPVMLGTAKLRAVAWTPSGLVSYFQNDTSTSTFRLLLVTVNPADQTKQVLATLEVSAASAPTWYSDGTSFAFADGSGSLWAANADGTNLRRLTATGGYVASQAAWQPDTTVVPVQIAVQPTPVPPMATPTTIVEVTALPISTAAPASSSNADGFGAAIAAIGATAQADPADVDVTRVQITQLGAILYDRPDGLAMDNVSGIEFTVIGKNADGNWLALETPGGTRWLRAGIISVVMVGDLNSVPFMDASAPTPDLIGTAVAATVAAMQPVTPTLVPTATPVPTSTPTPDIIATYVQSTLEALQSTVIPTLVPTAAGFGIRSESDFSPDVWTFSNEAGMGTFMDNAIQVKANANGFLAWSYIPEFNSDTLVMQVDIRSMAGGVFDCGVIFNKTGENQFYHFFISNNGSYSLWSREGGQFVPLVQEKYDPVVRPPADGNRVEITAQDGTIQLYINDIQMERINTVAHAGGRVGLAAESPYESNAPAYCAFDNLVITDDYSIVDSLINGIPAANTSALLPTAAPLEESPILFTDDFSSNQGWQSLFATGGTVDVRNGELRMTTVAGQAGLFAMLPGVEIDPRNFSIEIQTSFTPTDSDQWIGFVVGNPAAGRYHAFVMGDIWDYWNYLYSDVPADGEWNPLVNEGLPSGAADYNTPLTLQLEAVDSTYRLVVNGRRLPSIDITPYGTRIGLVIFNGDCCGSQGRMDVTWLQLTGSTDVSAFAPASANAAVIDVDYRLNCNDSPYALELSEGNSSVVSCSTNCAAAGAAYSSVWGTDIYTSDSSICRAAIHAGIPWSEPFIIDVVDGQSSYTGSTRNGVLTSSYGSWDTSFRVRPVV